MKKKGIYKVQPLLPDDASGSEVTVLFSGGLDSTATALILSKYYERVTLLTYTGIGGAGLYGLVKVHVRELQNKFGSTKFVHKYINIWDLWNILVLDSVDKDYHKYNSEFIWCMACKLAMNTQTIIYNLENGITTTFDGSIREQDLFVEQLPESLEVIRKFYSEYGLKFMSPLYEEGTRKMVLETLAQSGMSTGISVVNRGSRRVGSAHLGTQPLCLNGLFYGWMPALAFGFTPDYTVKDVLRYIHEKLKVAKVYIRRYFDNDFYEKTRNV